VHIIQKDYIRALLDLFLNKMMYNNMQNMNATTRPMSALVGPKPKGLGLETKALASFRVNQSRGPALALTSFFR
jgi:hypothetical protein